MGAIEFKGVFMLKRPIVIACIGYIIGIIYGLYFTKVSIALFFICVLITVLLAEFLNRNIKRYFKVIVPKKAIIILIMFILIGTSYVFLLNKKYNRIYEIKENIEIIGVIEQVEVKEYSYKYILKVETIGNKNYRNIKLILYTKKNKEILKYGDYIKLTAEYSLPEDSRNYKGFSYRDYLKQKGIYGTIEATGEIQLIESGKINYINKLAYNTKNIIIDKVNQNLSQEASSVFLGILLGDKSQISEDINTYFRQGNMLHILAVSGAHVSYVMLALSMLLSKSGKKVYLVCTIIILIFFMILTNFSPSVVRACIMAIISLIAKLIHKKSDIYNNLGISALIILLCNPYTVLNLGFQLTYLGTLGIVLFSKKMSIFLEKKVFNKEHKCSKLYLKNVIKDKLKKAIINLILISISVQILISPIILMNFNTLSYNFLISGIISTPIFAGIMIIGILFLISGPLKVIFFPILEILLKFLIFISKAISNLPFSTITLSTPNIVWVISYYSIVLAILFSKNKIFLRVLKNKEKIKKILKKIIAFFLILCIIAQTFKILQNGELRIYFIDVGQGDSSLIITPKNKVILIDGGGSPNENYDVGKNILNPYLLDRGINTIDYIMVSHFDNDHCGGLIYVIKTLKVKNILIAKQAKITKEYEEFMQIVKEKNINLLIVKQGDVINIENDLKMYILYPTSKLEFDDLNNNSIVAKLVYRNFSLLFTGDIEEEAERSILKKYSKNKLKSTVLKVAHHGSKTSSTEDFIKCVNPKIALIGVGKDNNFGHPNSEVITRLMNMRCEDL